VIVMPILEITPLGSTRSGTSGAVAAIVDYLTRGLQRGGQGIGLAAGYYADRPERPGIWRGSGVNHETLHGDASPEQLTRMLLGGHPKTGMVLVASIGSSGRAERHRSKPLDATDAAQWLTVQQTAERLGVDPSYVKRLLLQTERSNLDSTSPAPLQPLSGVRDGAGRWRVEPSEIDQFIGTRSESKVVVAYDATFKWEKSISLAWVQADDETRRIIEGALDIGVKTGIAFLESHGLQVRQGDRRVAGEGMWAVQYRHTTNRNLEPQLHDHVVIANISAPADGNTRTIAARSFFTHATTAGHLAGQAVRHELTRQLGYAWGPVVNGTCDIAGVPEVAMRIMSTRSREVQELAEVFGSSQQARRIAALTTRSRKKEPADWGALERKWRDQLDYYGFSFADEQALRHQQTLEHRTPKRCDALYAHLGSPAGVTRLDATFDRNTVIREVISWDGKTGGAAGLEADDVELLTDSWLASPNVARRTQGDRPRFTTVEMIQLEETVLRACQNGFKQHQAVVGPATIQTETILWQNSTGHKLGTDQAAFVQHLVSSGHQFGLGVGPAGTGKTASLAVACRAWEVAGYQPIGATVTGAAADVLAEACAIQTRTVASVVAEIKTGHNPFNKHSVLIIDEASTLSNRDHATIVTAVIEADATMRTIGDPVQHRAVEAGGL
jgi:conjugative relaxase-like TrwC/TraI family protein